MENGIDRNRSGKVVVSASGEIVFVLQLMVRIAVVKLSKYLNLGPLMQPMRRGKFDAANGSISEKKLTEYYGKDWFCFHPAENIKYMEVN